MNSFRVLQFYTKRTMAGGRNSRTGSGVSYTEVEMEHFDNEEENDVSEVPMVEALAVEAAGPKQNHQAFISCCLKGRLRWSWKRSLVVLCVVYVIGFVSGAFFMDQKGGNGMNGMTNEEGDDESNGMQALAGDNEKMNGMEAEEGDNDAPIEGWKDSDMENQQQSMHHDSDSEIMVLNSTAFQDKACSGMTSFRWNTKQTTDDDAPLILWAHTYTAYNAPATTPPANPFEKFPAPQSNTGHVSFEVVGDDDDSGKQMLSFFNKHGGTKKHHHPPIVLVLSTYDNTIWTVDLSGDKHGQVYKIIATGYNEQQVRIVNQSQQRTKVEVDLFYYGSGGRTFPGWDRYVVPSPKNAHDSLKKYKDALELYVGHSASLNWCLLHDCLI